MTHIVTLSVLILALIIIRAIFKKSASPVLIYGLWLCVVIKLVIPFSLYEVSIPSFLENEKSGIALGLDADTSMNGENTEQPSFFPSVEQDSEREDAGVLPIAPPDSEGSLSTHDVVGTEAENPGVILPINPTETEGEKPLAPSPVVGEEVKVENTAKNQISIKNLLYGIWAVGSGAFLAFFAVSYLVFSIKLLSDREYIEKYKGKRVYLSEKVGTPCLHGIFPSIYLTRKAYENEGRELILHHEYTHLCHGDTLWALVRIFLISALWWNPLAWAAALLSKQDGELACDYSVTRGLDERGRIGYARVIVDMLPVKRSLATGFANTSVKERIIMMTKKRKNKLFYAFVCLILAAAALGCAFAGRADEPKYDANQFFESCFEDFRGDLDFEVYDGKKVTYGYMHEAYKEKILQVAELILSAKSEKVDSVPYEKLGTPIYGMRFHNNNNGEDTSALWTSGYLFTDDGSFYKTDIDLSDAFDKYVADKKEGVLSSFFPGIRLIALQNGEWNRKYLEEDTSFDPSTVPESVSTEMISFFGEKLQVRLRNESESNWEFGEEYRISVLLDGKWYYVPGDLGTWISLLYSTFANGGEYEKSHTIPLDLPSGRYRVNTMETVFEFDIDYDKRQKEIEADKFMDDTAFGDAIDDALIAYHDDLYAVYDFRGEFAAAEHKLLGVTDEGEKLTAYVLACYKEWLYGDSNEIKNNFSAFTVTLVKNNGGYTAERVVAIEKEKPEELPLGLRSYLYRYKDVITQLERRLKVKAVEYFATSVDEVIGEQIDYIVSFAESLNIVDPLQSIREKEEYKALLEYGDYAVKYIYKQFMRYNPSGMKAELMLMLTEDITGKGRGIEHIEPSGYFYDIFNTARMVYDGDDENLKNENYYLYLYIEAAREIFDPAAFAAHIPNEGASVKLWHKIFANEIYLYFCVSRSDPRQMYIYYTDDFGDTIRSIDFEMPADIKYDSLMPIYAGNGAGSGECEFILRLTDEGRIFYVSFDNFDYTDESDFLVFKCRGALDEFKTARTFGYAELVEPKRKTEFKKSITLEGGALDGTVKNIEIEYYFEFGEYFISKSERAEQTESAEYEWEIVQCIGSYVLLYLGDGEHHYYKGINLLNGETVNYFSMISSEIIADSRSVIGSASGRFSIIETSEKAYIDNSIWGTYYDVYELSRLDGANFAKFVDDTHLFIAKTDKESGRIISGGVCDYMKFFNDFKRDFKLIIENGKFINSGVSTEGMKFFDMESRYATVYNENRFYIVDLITGLISEADNKYSFYNDTLIPIGEGAIMAVSERDDGYALILSSNGAVYENMRVEINVKDMENSSATPARGEDGYYVIIENPEKRYLYFVGSFD